MAKKGGKRKKKIPDHPGEKLICKNRRAAYNYELGERVEAGLVLRGTEVKSCRQGKAHLNDAYVQIKRGEAFLINSHIAEYERGGPYLNHPPTRARKLLMHRGELDKLARKILVRGFVAVPTCMYFKNGYIKVELAVARGRTHGDRRQRVKERETAREMQRAMRRAKV